MQQQRPIEFDAQFQERPGITDRGRQIGVVPAPDPLGQRPTIDESRRYVFDYLYSRGMDPLSIVGLAGNFQAESELDPLARGWLYRGERAQGIAQWRNPRTAALHAFAVGEGRSADAIDTQLDFALSELASTEARSRQMLERATNPRDAAAGGVAFERPDGYRGGDPTTASLWNRRLGYATDMFDQLAPSSRYVFELPDGRRAWVKARTLEEAQDRLRRDIGAPEDDPDQVFPLLAYDPGEGANRFVLESEAIEAQRRHGSARPAVEADRLDLQAPESPDAASIQSTEARAREFDAFSAFEALVDNLGRLGRASRAAPRPIPVR